MSVPRRKPGFTLLKKIRLADLDAPGIEDAVPGHGHGNDLAEPSGGLAAPRRLLRPRTYQKIGSTFVATYPSEADAPDNRVSDER